MLYRGPFNLPVARGDVTDDERIKRALPSLEHIIKNGGKLVLVGYLGRPKGKVVEELRMDPVGRAIESNLRSQGLDISVRKLDAVVGEEAKQAIRTMGQGELILLENVRFYPQEEKCDPKFSRELASLADVFVNDAPTDMHRKASSTLGVTDYLISAAGFLMDKEITTLRKMLSPPPGSALVLGGSKVKGKFETIEGLVGMYDHVIIGGAMANVFLAATGINLTKDEEVGLYGSKIRELLLRYGSRILLPRDVVIADPKAPEYKKVILADENARLNPNFRAVDTGPATNERNAQAIENSAGYIVWNGPFGWFELGFTDGTRAVARAISDKYQTNETFILGGDTHAAVQEFRGFRFRHILTGGGSSLEFLEKRGDPACAPGLTGLEKSYEKARAGGYGDRAAELIRR